MKKSKCIRCGEETTYHPTQSSGKYCSIKCQQVYRIEKNMESGDCNYTHGIRRWCYENLPQICECGTDSIWNQKPLRLQVDHKDGNTQNNRKDNLRMICPNCHTQTDNWGVKNASVEGVKKMKEAAYFSHKVMRDKKFGGIAQLV